MNLTEYTQKLVDKMAIESQNTKNNLIKGNFNDILHMKYSAGFINGIETAMSISKEFHDSFINESGETTSVQDLRGTN